MHDNPLLTPPLQKYKAQSEALVQVTDPSLLQYSTTGGEGTADGVQDGRFVGGLDGMTEGETDGLSLGVLDGDVECVTEGKLEGVWLGLGDGMALEDGLAE